MTAVPTHARAEAVPAGDLLVVSLGGVWRITQPLPVWRKVRGEHRPRAVRLDVTGLESWDSSLVRFVREVEAWCRAAKVTCDSTALPDAVRRLVDQLVQAQEKPRPARRANSRAKTMKRCSRRASLRILSVNAR